MQEARANKFERKLDNGFVDLRRCAATDRPQSIKRF